MTRRGLFYNPPDRATSGGHIYIIEFSDGTVKVGSTTTPASRIRAHRSDAEAFGLTIAYGWLSGNHDKYIESERRLITAAASMATSRGRLEYFRGISVPKLLAAAREIVERRTVGDIRRYTSRSEPLHRLEEVAAMTGSFFPVPYLRKGCAEKCFPHEVRDGEYMLTDSQVRMLLDQHSLGGDRSNPTRPVTFQFRTSMSVLHRQSRRPA